MSSSKIVDRAKKDIEAHGWHVISVVTEDTPCFSYTVGFEKTLNHPEVIMSGLDTKLMHQLLNDVGALIQSDEIFDDGVFSDNVINGFPVKFVTVKTTEVSNYFGVAEKYYGNIGFRALQCIWPDQDGSFQLETDQTQEILG